MKSIAFIDAEINPKNGSILDIGGVDGDGNIFHSKSVIEFGKFIDRVEYLCGHNIVDHDLKYLKPKLNSSQTDKLNAIDTLYWSPLLFPERPYHRLLKDDKIISEELSNPLNDSKKARELFYDEVTAFNSLDGKIKSIFYGLLHDRIEFEAFFRYLNYAGYVEDLNSAIFSLFKKDICENADLAQIIEKHPVELAYCLSLINADSRYSITPAWVLKNYPCVERVMFQLRNKPCHTKCFYCSKKLDAHTGLKNFFGFESFRSYDGEPLQEKAVKAAIEGKSILAVFPTGGGKSLTFQVPALMSGETSKGLTIVISPLQSLMKDQVDNLEKNGIVDAVTINGLLDPIERAKSIERVAEGSASLLYISPESLRSKTIERLIKSRKVSRFVIDEAHCFSSWGQDFRVDYLYIGDFIKKIQDDKQLEESIPVSCFTATAKRKVVEDICEYFKEKLSLDLQIFSSKASRTNLSYQVLSRSDDEEKYQTIRELIENNDCPTIIYVSRTHRAYKLSERLTEDGFSSKPFHGKMEAKEKTENQNDFITGKVSIMVATSAFGMGVDKKDVGMVIHYDISDSLENYIQEAGRAGRDEAIKADCYVLFDEEDLSKHFLMLNQTKLSIKEIQQVWKAIKDITKYRSKVSNSALEIARKAGWDDSVSEIETRVKTAIAALEDAGYLKRGQNMPRVFADSILARNAQEAIDKIDASPKFDEKEKVNATRIIKKLFSSKSKSKSTDDTAESRVDYISDHLGIIKADVLQSINLMREEKILADTKDLTAFIKRKESENRSKKIVQSFSSLEKYLISVLEKRETGFHLKKLNEDAEKEGIDDVDTVKIKTIINFWNIKEFVKKQVSRRNNNYINIVPKCEPNELLERIEKRHKLAVFITRYLFELNSSSVLADNSAKEESLVSFSVHELKEAYGNSIESFGEKATIEEVEEALFFLSKIEAIKIEGGFLVVYNGLSIERLETDNYKRYTKDDYKNLETFYENKVQQVHIVGEYAKKMIQDYKEALQFVEDYFHLNYSSFLRKYFPGSKSDFLRRRITEGKFKQLFGELSPAQLKVIKDNETKYIVVAAGPGSGKTRVLVHKLASLLLMEDVKHEQLLMLTFSRAAASEFKQRLRVLIGGLANFIEIKTFHSYCFDLLGRVGSVEHSGTVLQAAVQRIRDNKVEPNRITKTVMVIDEAQDMDADEFNLVKLLMERNEEMRVIAVGDDDQNIYEFRGSDSKYLESLIHTYGATKHELVQNFRSKKNLVDFSNLFTKKITKRLKSTPISAEQKDNGKIDLVKYQEKNLVTPLVERVYNEELIGTTCILTITNEESLQVVGRLLKLGVQAKLIQTNDSFNLHNLHEIRYFVECLRLSNDIYVIDDEVWKEAKRKLKSRFQKSSKYGIVQNLIKEFELSNPKRKFKTDLDIFIRESKLEDFSYDGGETIYVSTIHKAKGREFDNVFLLVNDFSIVTDEQKRKIYVAITRAKQSLSIHTTESLFDKILVDEMRISNNAKSYGPTDFILMQLSYRDVWLGYFRNRQREISKLISGDELQINEGKCLNAQGTEVLKFSKQFTATIEQMKTKGYLLKSAKVNMIVYWKDEEVDREFLIVLPELYFERKEATSRR